MQTWEYLANSTLPAPWSLDTLLSRIHTRRCSMTMRSLLAERHLGLSSGQHRKSCKVCTCSLLSSSLPFAVGVEGTQICRRAVVPDVAFVCLAQVVVGLIAWAHAITTDVDGSMNMLQSIWYSALCWHRVTPESYSVADPHQPPARMQASHADRDCRCVFVFFCVFFFPFPANPS